MLADFTTTFKEREKGKSILQASCLVGINAFSWEEELVSPTQALLYRREV